MSSSAQLVMRWPLGQAFARRTVMIALALCAAGVPLLPSNEMKVAGTFLAGFVLVIGVYASLRSGETLQRTALDAPAMMFFVLAVLATVFGVNPRLSFVPNTTRGEGLLDYVVYVPMALAAARLSRLEIREILAVLLGAGGLIGAVAIGQYYGIDATTWIGIRGLHWDVRSWGTLSNPDFMGGYATLVLPIGVALAAGAVDRRQWWGYAAASTLLYAALFGSQTRSAWAATALAAVILVRRFPRSRQTCRRLVLLALVFAAVTTAMIVTQPQRSISGRVASAFHDRSMLQRLWIWEHGVDMIRQRPVLGWGFSAVIEHLPGIGSPGYYRAFPGRSLFVDVVHNDLLQVAVNMGLTGLLAYLWIWATVIRALHGAADGSASLVGSEAAGILAGLGAYFVWLQFLWSHIGDTNVFWVLTGIAVSLGRAARAPVDGTAQTD